jgi:DNA-directed RNA polymerase specialized sigma24 family protein
MLTNSLNADQESVTLDRATRIRAVIAEEHEALLRSVAVLIAKTEPRLRWPEVMDKASEILHEAVQESLQHAFAFDPSRSATAWVRGIAARLLLTRRRVEARGRRCVSATVLGEASWVAALGQLGAGSTEGAVAERLDLEAAIGRICPEERHAIECRYYRGLDGNDLASALGVATVGAARVRVCRALQALRAQFPLGEEEVLP